MPGVVASQRVQVLQGSVRDELGLAPDLDEAAGVLGIDHEQADLRAGEQVAPLLAFERGVHPRAQAVVVRPHQA